MLFGINIILAIGSAFLVFANYSKGKNSAPIRGIGSTDPLEDRYFKDLTFLIGMIYFLLCFFIFALSAFLIFTNIKNNIFFPLNIFLEKISFAYISMAGLTFPLLFYTNEKAKKLNEVKVYYIILFFFWAVLGFIGKAL